MSATRLSPLPVYRRAILVLLLGGLAVLPFLAGVQGAFVYDDVPQVRSNASLLAPGLLSRAFSRDVWSFKGDRPEPWSTYWRPGFVLWLAALARLFGVSSPLPWHAASLALHAAVVLLAHGVLRRCGLAKWPAAVLSMLFAVHPTRVESVVWISGAPDLLLALFLLASLYCLLPEPERTGPGARAAALALFACALLAKESALLFPLVVLALGWEGTTWVERTKRAARLALPYVLLAGAALAARAAALDGLTSAPFKLAPLEAMVNGPRLVAFYFGKLVWPLPTSPSYPFRVAPPAGVRGAELATALLATGLVVALLGSAARSGRSGRVGAAIAVAMMAPALAYPVFHPEQVVHDRYLYLPWLGVLLALAAVGARIESRFAPPPMVSPWQRPARASIAVVLAAVLAVSVAASASESRLWRSELALWERAAAVDPSSRSVAHQLALARAATGDLAGALTALPAQSSGSAVGEPVPLAIGRAEILLAAGRFAEAEALLADVTRAAPGVPLAWERLALARERRGDLEGASLALVAGRREVPWRRCSFTSNLAVLRVRLGDRADALAELEAVRSLVQVEGTVPCFRVLWQLASLHREAGRLGPSRDALAEFVRAVPPGLDPGLDQLRREATSRLVSATSAP